MPEPADTRTISFADLAGYTALTEAHGDAGAADVAERFFELTLAVLPDEGRLVKTIGDAVLVVMPNAPDGLQFGLDLLRAVEAEREFPGVRIGLHHGPVVQRKGDVFGTTVNIAARLTAHAHVGQLLTTDSVAAVAGSHERVAVTALGAIWLKNVGDPVEVFEVSDHTVRPTSQVLDPVCRMFIDADAAPARLPWGGRGWHFCSFECAAAFSQDPARYHDADEGRVPTTAQKPGGGS